MAVVFLRSCKPVDLLDPERKNILISDISHSLSHLSHFQGHSCGFVSEAERSIILSKHCIKQAKRLYSHVEQEHRNELIRLSGLDALMYFTPYAYIGKYSDTVWTLIDSKFSKHNYLRYCERALRKVIYKKLVKDHIPDSVRNITLSEDTKISRTEKCRYEGKKLSIGESIYNEKTIQFKNLSSSRAQKKFLRLYNKLVSY